MRTAEIIFYNHDMLTPAQAPKDWDDLVEPGSDRKLLLRDVVASGTMRSVFSALIGRAVARTGKVEVGYDFLRALDRNTKDYPANPSDLFLRVRRQEAAVGIWNLQDILVQRSKGAPFTAVMPASGAPFLLDGVGKIKGGPHGGAADTFLDFLLRPSTQQMLADKSFQFPTVPIARPPSWQAGVTLGEMAVDWPSVDRHEAEWMDYWVQHIKNRS